MVHPGTIKVSVVKNIVTTRRISLYPNPAKDLLIISLPESSQNVKSKVITASGKIMMTMNQTRQNLNVDISALTKGIYYVQIFNIGSVSFMQVVT